jgi:hypothetical protein
MEMLAILLVNLAGLVEVAPLADQMAALEHLDKVTEEVMQAQELVEQVVVALAELMMEVVARVAQVFNG